jgi:hypothetical protein
MSKMRMNYYECKCGWKGAEPFGSTSITWGEDGEPNVECSPYRCPFCGSEKLEHKSEVVELVVTNQSSSSSLLGKTHYGATLDYQSMWSVDGISC